MTDRKRREVNTAFVRRHYAIGPTAYDTTTGNPLRWPTPADVAYCEQQFDAYLAAHDAEIREQIAREIDYAAESLIEGPEARGIRYAAKVVRQRPTR